MEAKTNQTETVTPKKKKSLLKKLAIGFAAVIVLILLLGLLLPTLVSTPTGKNIILGQINKSVDGTVEVKNLSLGWFSGLKLTGVHFKDNAGTTDVMVDEIRLSPKLSSLMRGQINLTDGLIDKPQVEITVKEKPQAAQKPSESKPKLPSSGESKPIAFPVEKLILELRQGNAVIKTEQPPQRIEFKNITTKVDVNPAGQASNLSFALAVAGLGEPGDVKATATITPTQGVALKGTSGTVQVELVNLKLEDFKPLLALAGQNKIDIAGLVNAKADVKINDGNFEKISADATVEKFKQTLDGKTTTMEKPIKFSADASYINNNLRVDNVTVDSSFCSASAKGDLSAITYQAKADLAGAQAVASQFADMAGLKLAGSMNAAGSVKMQGQTITAAGNVDFANLAVTQGANKLAPTAIKIKYDDVVHDGAAKLLKAKSIDVTMDAGTVAVKNLLLPEDAKKATQVSTDADVALDLQKALALAKVFVADKLPKDLTVSGMFTSKLNVQPKDGDILFKTEKTEIQKLVLGQTGQTPFTQDALTLVADGSVNPTTKKFAANFDLQGKKAESLMSVKGTVSQKADKDQTALAGDVQAQYDLKDITAMAKPYLPKGLDVQGKRNDKITFASTYPTAQPDKMLANLDASAAVGFDKANFQGLQFGTTELKLNVKKGQAAIDLPDAAVNGGKVRFAGDVDLGAKPMVLKLRKPGSVVENVQIDDVVSANLLQYLHPVFANSSNVSGTANLSCSTLVIPLGGGTPKDINIEGTIGMTDVKLNSTIMKEINKILAMLNIAFSEQELNLNLFSIPSSAFTVKDGIVKYDDMPLMFGRTWAIHFGGKIGLIDKNMDMKMSVPSSKKSDATLYHLPLTGSVNNPKIDYTELLKSNLTEQLKDKIPVKDEKTKDAVDKGLQIFEGILKGQK